MHAHSRAEGPSRLPAGLTVEGDLASEQDLAIDGTFDGVITLPGQHLTIGASARVKAKIVAGAVTILGRLEGSVTATERVRIETGAWVQAHLQTPSLVLTGGAHFTGSVDPSRTEAAMLVARYRQKQG
jgi:cytoskeletal protein CcmA (bactofilin family)